MKYKSLEDVILPDDDIESGIQNLVRALQVIGLIDSYSSSCEGHVNGVRQRDHPWIAYMRFIQGVEAETSLVRHKVLEYLVKEYNKKSVVKWFAGKYLADIHMIAPEKCKNKKIELSVGVSSKVSNDELKLMQESADELALYIFENTQEVLDKYKKSQ